MKKFIHADEFFETAFNQIFLFLLRNFFYCACSVLLD